MANNLKALVRRQEPERGLDLLLVSSLIEARSHERLGLLGGILSRGRIGSFLSRFNGFGSTSLWSLLASSLRVLRSQHGTISLRGTGDR
jgi:hypothetical protein